MPLRIAIAHDYLTQRGGAERVVLSLARAFPDAEIHTLFHAPDQTYPEFRDRVIRTSPLNRIGPFRRDPRLALPLLAPFATRMRIDADLVIASSSGWAHAFPTAGRRIVYCHSPARWLYLPGDYLGDAGRLDPKRLALTALRPLLTRWDRRAASRAGTYLANSTVVRERIRNVYEIESETVFPPFSPAVAEGDQAPIPSLAGWAGEDGISGGHHLVVSRLQPYKHVDAVIQAFSAMPEHRLLVVGRGPERDRLAAMAPHNVRLVEGLSDAQMRWAYGNARALIAASHEDFGLTPLEAGAHGVPTLALRAGGYLDTVEEGINGLFIDLPTAGEIVTGVCALDQAAFDPERIREHVSAFSEDRFIARIRALASGAAGASSCADTADRSPLSAADDDDRSAPEISVVIPAYNAASTIGAQLAALRAQVDPPKFEVIIADNRSTDATAAVARATGEGLDLRVIAADRAQGVNPARNDGRRFAAAPLVLFIDADDRIGQDALRALVDAFADEPTLALATGVPEGEDSETYSLPVAQDHLPYGIGAFLAVRQEVFQRIGGFDEDFRGGHDEVDFCWRAQDAGFALGLVRQARFSYEPRASVRAAFRQYRNYGRTYVQLYAKHRSQGIEGSTATAEIRSLTGVPGSLWRILRTSEGRQERVRGLGWLIGRWQGHLRYRVWGPR